MAILAILAGIQGLQIPMTMTSADTAMPGMESRIGPNACEDRPRAMTAGDECGAICAASIAVIGGTQPFRVATALSVEPMSSTRARSHHFPPDIAPPRT